MPIVEISHTKGYIDGKIFWDENNLGSNESDRGPLQTGNCQIRSEKTLIRRPGVGNSDNERLPYVEQDALPGGCIRIHCHTKHKD